MLMSMFRISRLSRKLAHLGLLSLLLSGLVLVSAVSAQEPPVVHIVRPGETLYFIANRYGVTMRAIMQANGLRNPNVIYVGQELTIPASVEGTPTLTATLTATATFTPLPEGEQVHVVQRGQTLYSIALRYNVTVGELMRANGLRNPNLLRVGQRLIIPSVPAPTTLPPAGPPTDTPTPTSAAPAEPTPTPAAPATPTSVEVVPTPAPAPLPAAAQPLPLILPAPPGQCLCDEVIYIASPAQNQTIVSPAVVTGMASAFEQQVTVRILDESGAEVGLGVGFIDADMGQRGPFTATVPFVVPLNSQFGRVQVYSVSPRDGAVEHLNSVTVRLQGLDLDPVIDLLREAIETKDYEDLRGFMPPDGFAIGVYQSEGQVVAPDEVIQQLKDQYLGPGNVKLDLSVDARSLLKDRVAFPPSVRWVGYSTGWGSEGKDDAFLLIMERDGRAFWGGLLYVPAGLVDYR
jgi:LysM repeat protein